MSNDLEKKMDKGFEDMAIMIANGFKEVHKEIQDLRSEALSTKHELLEKLANQRQVDDLESRVHKIEEHAVI
jgi:wobble nucleotide-excising tRNase